MKRPILKLCTFMYEGVSYPYELHVGGVKRLNLRIRPDGSIRVSVPARCSAAIIEQFLLQCAPRMVTAIRQKQIALSEQSNRRQEIRYLGKILPITVVRTDHGRAVCNADDEEHPTHLTVTVSQDAKAEQMQAAIVTWQKNRLLEILQEIHSRVILAAFAGLPLTAQQREWIEHPCAFRIRTMKSRWGSCNTATGAMAFNLFLLEQPYSCIEYVAMHEFAHLLQPDHSPAYHALMDRLMPDWRERRICLNGKTR